MILWQWSPWMCIAEVIDKGWGAPEGTQRQRPAKDKIGSHVWTLSWRSWLSWWCDLYDDDSSPVHFPIETLRGIRTARVAMLIGCSSVRTGATQVSVHSSDPSSFALQQSKAFFANACVGLLYISHEINFFLSFGSLFGRRLFPSCSLVATKLLALLFRRPAQEWGGWLEVDVDIKRGSLQERIFGGCTNKKWEILPHNKSTHYPQTHKKYFSFFPSPHVWLLIKSI